MGILEELELISRIEFPGEYIDFDGTRRIVPLSSEQEAIIDREQMLKELTTLRSPLPPEWAVEMHFGWCCNPMPEEDLLGDWHGRNE